MLWFVTKRKLIPARTRMNDNCSLFGVNVGSTAKVVNAKIFNRF